MKPLLTISTVIDRITAAIGRAVSWLILVAVLISAGNAIVRKAFNTSSNAWLEAQWYLYGAVFLLAAAYALQRNDHVRIDVIFGNLPHRARHWINLFGHCFMLMPFTILMVYLCVPFVLTSFRQQEISTNAGGLILWPAKILILGGFALLVLQGISEIIKTVAILRGLIPDPHEELHEHIEAEAMAPERKP